MELTPNKKVAAPESVVSPDIFAGSCGSDEDSFDIVDGGVGRKRSNPIELTLNSEFDTTLKENTHLDDSCDDGNDTITRLLNEDSEAEGFEGSNDGMMCDALASVLNSFKNDNKRSVNETVHCQPSTSEKNQQEIVIGDEQNDERMDEEDNSNESTNQFNQTKNNRSFHGKMHPVALPFRGNSNHEKDGSPPKKMKHIEEDKAECQPSTSSKADGPVACVSSDVGGYWNQQKTIEVNGRTYEIDSYADYMRMKIDKLNHQVNTANTKPYERISNVFEGYSVFVNGFTDPPALVIRDLMLSHGGEYHCYYMHGKTSYVIASSIANAKVDRLREKEIYIRVDWITESITAGKALNYKDYLIYEKGAKEKGNMQKFLAPPEKNIATSSSVPPSTQEHGFLDARNPDFIKNYYARSRLHLISTLAQDMKDFVANLKQTGNLEQSPLQVDQLKMLGEPGKRNTEKNKKMGPIIFHVDLDCFFVSVALRTREDLKETPVAITHSKGTTSNSMSEIASCSYAARSCGVRNGMLVKHALQMCPRLVLLPYQFDDYIDVSKQIYNILSSYTLEIRAVSCDEMYINVTSLCEKFCIADPCRIAEHIRENIRKETGCPASVGIGPNSLLARLATRHAKPDGVHYVRENMVFEFMKNEKIKDLPGLGYQMMDRIESVFGPISTCDQLQSRSEQELIPVFGPKLALKILNQCRGEEPDAEDFWKTQMRKSVSCDINYGIRFEKKEELVQLVKAIGAELERKLTDCRMTAGAITLKLMVRSSNASKETAKFMGHGVCDTFTKTSNMNVSTSKAELIANETLKLYHKISPRIDDLRGVGVTCGKLKTKTRKNVVDAIQEMFGKAKGVHNTDVKVKTEPNVENEDGDEMGIEAICCIEPKFSSSDDQAQLSKEALRILNIPDTEDLLTGTNMKVPDVLKSSELQVARFFRGLVLDGVPFDNTNEIEKVLLRICSNEPSKEEVTKIDKFFYCMLKTGNLNSLKLVTSIFLDICQDSTRSHTDWFGASYIIIDKLTKESELVLEFPIDFHCFSYESVAASKSIETERMEKDNSKNAHLLIREVNICDTTNCKGIVNSDNNKR